MHEAYIVLLLIVGMTVAVRVVETGDLALLLCAAAIISNWAINTGYVLATDETDATACFLLVDTLSLVLVLYVAWKLAIGQMLASSYIGQIILHGLHLAGASDPYRYWEMLTLLAFGQLVVLAIWAALPGERRHGVV